jgi:hypothetical protein
MVADAVGSASPEGTGAVVDDPSCAVDGAGASVGVDTTAPGGVVETLGPGLAVRDRFRRGRDRPDGGPSAVPVPMSPGPEAAPAPSGDSTAGGSGASSSSDGAGSTSSGAAVVPGTSVMSKRRSSSSVIGKSKGERGPWGGVARENGETNDDVRRDAREQVDEIFNLR